MSNEGKFEHNYNPMMKIFLSFVL